MDERVWQERLALVEEDFLRELDEYFPSSPGSEGTLGPFNGGCLVVASALQSVIGGELLVMENRDGVALHAVVLQDGRLWDWDGPLEPVAFADRYNGHVDEDEYLLVGHRPFREHDLNEAMESEELSRRLSAYFVQMLEPAPSMGAAN